MNLDEYLAVPYVAVFYSMLDQDGKWIRVVEYPELPNCIGTGPSAIEALDRAESARIAFLVRTYREGGEIPLPRPPLRSAVSGLTAYSAAQSLSVFS